MEKHGLTVRGLKDEILSSPQGIGNDFVPLSSEAPVAVKENRQSVKVLRWDGINLFDYIVDILDKTGTWQPNTPLAKYRDLLPDRWVTK